MRKICVITGTRAEYGLLRWIMQGIKEDSDLTLQIIATGMHLSPEFGLTYRIIEQDGFEIDRKVEMNKFLHCHSFQMHSLEQRKSMRREVRSMTR